MKYIAIRSGATSLPEQSVAHLTHDITLQSGVLDLLSNHWKVTEHNPQNMSVDIQLGRGYFKKPSITYQGYTDGIDTVPIASNNSGNPRISALVRFADLSVTPNTDGSNVIKDMEVQGTPAASPAAPTDNEIQNAIGAGNPFIRLANIAVANSASSIINSNITDTRAAGYFKLGSGLKDTDILNVKSSGNYQKIISDQDGSTITFDMDGVTGSNYHEATLGGNRTLAVSNVKIGQPFIVRIKQDATGGRIATWWAGINWPDSVVPTLTVAGGKTDIFGFIKNSSGQFDAAIIGQNY